MKADVADLIDKKAALKRLFRARTPEYRTEEIPLETGADRVLAADVLAGYDLPVERASTMDGIAVQPERFTDGMPDTFGWNGGRRRACWPTLSPSGAQRKAPGVREDKPMRPVGRLPRERCAALFLFAEG